MVKHQRREELYKSTAFFAFRLAPTVKGIDNPKQPIPLPMTAQSILFPPARLPNS
jgi:hypothetical protein